MRYFIFLPIILVYILNNRLLCMIVQKQKDVSRKSRVLCRTLDVEKGAGGVSDISELSDNTGHSPVLAAA